jgi:hypothetical protein
VTERDLFLVDPIAASDLYLDGYLAGKSAVRSREVPAAWNRGFLTCLLIIVAIWLFRVLT